MTHTPGPWHIAQDENENFCIYGGHSVNSHALVYNVNYRSEESRANALLIEVAPNLLALVREQVEAMSNMPMNDINYAGREWMMKAMVVLRCAEGK